MDEPVTDGRRAKGERRRRELIEATLRVVAREGVAGVSHRTVAREADMPATAAAYYFHGITDLLTAALTRSMEDDVERISAMTADPTIDGVRALAEFMAAEAAEPGRLLGDYELFLLAVRDPALRPVTHRWLAALADVARRHTDDPMRVEAVAALVDGLLLQAMLRDTPPDADHLEAVLRVAACS